MNYFSNIYRNIIKEDEDLFLDWMFNLCYIYSYRCKTYSKLNLQDNILFILLNCTIEHYNKLVNDKIIETNNIIYNVIEENIDILNIKYDEIKKYGSKVVYETLILGLLKITIESSLNNIQNNNVFIGDYNYIINSVSEDGNILHNFDIIKNYVLNNNRKLVEKYINLNKILYNKLNRKLVDKIYKFYIDLIHIFIEKNVIWIIVNYLVI